MPDIQTQPLCALVAEWSQNTTAKVQNLVQTLLRTVEAVQRGNNFFGNLVLVTTFAIHKLFNFVKIVKILHGLV